MKTIVELYNSVDRRSDRLKMYAHAGGDIFEQQNKVVMSGVSVHLILVSDEDFIFKIRGYLPDAITFFFHPDSEMFLMAKTRLMKSTGKIYNQDGELLFDSLETGGVH